MSRRFIITEILIAVIWLSGCSVPFLSELQSGTTSDVENNNIAILPDSDSQSQTSTDTTPQSNTKSVPRSCPAQAADIDDTLPVLSVDGRNVAGWRYLYWLTSACDQVMEEYGGADMEVRWGSILDENITLEDYVRQQAMQDCTLYATVENLADSNHCVLSDEDKAALTSEWQENAINHGGEENYLKELSRTGLNQERAIALAEVGVLYRKLEQLSETPGSTLAPSAEELRAYAESQGALTIYRILVSDQQQAETIYAALNSAEDLPTAFASQAASDSDTFEEYTFCLGDGTLDDSLEKAATALVPGQMSGILESPEGFSILLRLETDIAAFHNDWFDQKLQTQAKSAKIMTTSACEDLSVALFTQRLALARANLQNADTLSSYIGH